MLRWTGDGWAVSDSLDGRVVGGVMLDSLSFDSKAVLEYLNESHVTMSGLSRLTVADGI